MKTKIFTLLFISLGLLSQAQDNSREIKKKLFNNSLDNVVNSYMTENNGKGNVIQPSLLSERLSQAFNQVVFGNSNLVENASAFGVNQDEDAGTVSVNTNFRLNDNTNWALYLTTGINASGSGSIFNLYSENAWQSQTGASAGFILKLPGSGFSNEKETKLVQNKVLRKIFIKDSILNNLLSLNLENYKKLRDSFVDFQTHILQNIPLSKPYETNAKAKKGLERITKKLTNYEEFFLSLENSIKDIKKRYVLQQDQREDKNKDTLESNKVLLFKDYSANSNVKNDSIIESLLDTLWSENEKGKEFLTKYIEKVAAEFDKKNVRNTGYKFGWFGLNLGLTNNTFNFSEKAENIDSSVLANFQTNHKDDYSKNRLNTEINFSFSYAWNSKYKGAFFGKLGFGFHSGSFLNSNLINGTAKITSELPNNKYVITDDNNRILGHFDAIHQNLQYGSINSYLAFYLGEKKIFGFNLAASQYYKIKTPQSTMYDNNYSVLFGPIFRKPDKDGGTGLTFGIDVGIDNAPHISKGKDFFVTRIRVGIPLKLYNINKS